MFRKCTRKVDIFDRYAWIVERQVRKDLRGYSSNPEKKTSSVGGDREAELEAAVDHNQ
jgi:hypothetical protein